MEIKGWGLCVGVSRRGANLAKEGHNAQKWVRPGSKFSWAQAWVWPVRQVFGCKIALYLFDDFCRQLLRKMKVAILVLALVAFVHADMYLHNPRLVCMCTVNSILWAQLVASMYVIYIYFLPLPGLLFPTGARTIAWTRPDETETTQTGTCFFSFF